MTGTWIDPHCFRVQGKWDRKLDVEDHTPKAERRDPNDYCDVPKDRIAISITTRNGMTVPIRLTREDALAVADVIREMAGRMEASE